MLVPAKLIVRSTRRFACILAKWFWPTVMSLSLTYGSSKQANTYFGRRSAGLIKVLDSWYFVDDGIRNSYGRNNPIFEY